MSDLEERLREAISASVAGAEPAFDVMSAVRRRHRRWLFQVTAAVAAAATAATVGAVLLGVPHGKLGHAAPAASATKPNVAHHASPLFPGGGRLLLSGGAVGGLSWLYPDGRTVRFAPGFAGAAPAAGGLLAWMAWKYTGRGPGYYTMRLDGSQRRLVLPAERNRLFDDIQAVLSPDGSKLAYLRQQVNAPQGNNTWTRYTLWVIDLATGRRVDLGPVWWSSLAWRDDTTILATAADGRALLLVSAVTGSRSAYLAVTDPALAAVYEHARPGAGPPASIGSAGWGGSGTSAPLAVWLAAAGQAKPAELVLAGRTVLGGYAPASAAPQQLDFTWGPNGLFLIQAGEGNDPASWRTYAGTVHSDRLSPLSPYVTNGITFNPAGNVIAGQNDSREVVFLPTPPPACERATKCLNFPVQFLTGQGDLQAWAR